ncbi:MmcQ/YjbR family DNA-binding protein [Aestuariimicrobium soli]|uniref:MmcQ/YjbR family DNA-binding protein n=1 Tax=Aestuariimicrobium soli TaxID=2035834 RepID=UPI003EBF3550
MASKTERAPIPLEFVERVRAVMDALPRTHEEDAWTGVRWRVRQVTIAHLFGGEDQQVRITFKGSSDEVHAFGEMGHPYFRTEWSEDTIGMVLDASTDWQEVAEMLQDSYRLQTGRPAP